MSKKSAALRTRRNAVVNHPPVLLDSFEVTTALHFTGSATSNVNLGALHDAAGTLWLSLWFKLDSLWDSSQGSAVYLFGKQVDFDDQFVCQLAADGTVTFFHREGAATLFLIASVAASFQPDEWNHVLCSVSAANGARLVVNGATPVTNADTTALSIIADLIIGNLTDGAVVGLVGEIRDFAIGTDDLSGAEEADLLNGIVPVDATEYYPLNEGTGVVALDYGSGGNNGTIDSANSWEGTGAQASITVKVPDDGYAIHFLKWQDLMINNAAAQNLQLVAAGGAGEYDYSRQAEGTISNSLNGQNFILMGIAGDTPGEGIKSSGFLRITNNLAQEKVFNGEEVQSNQGQTNIQDVEGFHIEAKDQTADAEIASYTITPAAGSIIGGGKVYLFGVRTPKGS